jgi:drug/metabolite transporter (DMT)-like permease
MKKNALFKGYALVILSAVLFGFMGLINSYIDRDAVSRETVVLLRNALGLPVLAIMARKQQKTLRIPVKAVPGLALIALLGCCATPLLLYKSYGFIQSGTATVFHFVYPAVVVVLSLVFLRQKMKPATLLAVGLCVVGICLFFDPSQTVHPLGSALALLSGITYAVYILLLSSFRHRDIAGFRLSFCIAAVSTLLLLAVCLCGRMLTLPTTLSGWCCAFALALTVNVGAVVLFQQGTFLVGGERASILSTFEPITGVLLGVLVFRETVGARTLLGTCLVLLAAVCIAAWDMRKTK